jgi:hypothetical protein
VAQDEHGPDSNAVEVPTYLFHTTIKCQMGRDATISLNMTQAMATVDILYLSLPASLQLVYFLLNVL